MPTRPTSRNAHLIERRKLAVELRKQGATFDQIAEQLKGYFEGDAFFPASYDRGSARQDVLAVLKALNAEAKEEAEELRALELARLDDLHAVYYEKAINGDGFALDRVLAIQARRARYTGIEAPNKADVTSAGQPVALVQIVNTPQPPPEP